MTETANLGLPFIDGSQAQKHVTHNEALRILDATIQCFLELGYHRTTTTEIAKRAHVTRGAVQYYFPTTPDVLRAHARIAY